MSNKTMFVTVKAKLPLLKANLDGTREIYMLQPGRYELEKIITPISWGYYWLVLKGTLIGKSENGWLYGKHHYDDPKLPEGWSAENIIFEN